MKNFPVVAVGLTLLVLLGGIFLFSGNKEVSPEPAPATPTAHEYFWGEGCPHCAIVEEFFSTWEGKDKVEVKKLEVWYNKTNALLYNQRADACQIPKDQRGVPLLYTLDGKCLTGDEPIIQFFKELELSK